MFSLAMYVETEVLVTSYFSFTRVVISISYFLANLGAKLITFSL